MPLALFRTTPLTLLHAAGESSDQASALSYVLLLLIGVGIALMLFCVFTIHKNPYFSEMQKLGWLLLALALPIFGPLAWIVRARLESKHQLRLEQESPDGAQAVGEGSKGAQETLDPFQRRRT